MEKRRKQVLAASFLAGAFAVTAGFAVQGHARAAQYRRMLDNTYQHAFTELATAAGEPFYIVTNSIVNACVHN